jgi:hypothetical protein
VHQARTQKVRLPSWWSQLDGDRPVVHVTQGTIDNADLGQLLEPTIEALAGEDVVVVATTGGRAVAKLDVPVPPNTFIAECIPHDLLLPKVDVMVTNGGYGAVQRALSTGVPLVVAGNTEDKPEVAAPVEWSGAAINLRTGTPTPGAVRHGSRGAQRQPLPAPGPRVGGGVRSARRRRRDCGADRRGRPRASTGGRRVTREWVLHVYIANKSMTFAFGRPVAARPNERSGVVNRGNDMAEKTDTCGVYAVSWRREDEPQLTRHWAYYLSSGDMKAALAGADGVGAPIVIRSAGWLSVDDMLDSSSPRCA